MLISCFVTIIFRIFESIFLNSLLEFERGKQRHDIAANHPQKNDCADVLKKKNEKEEYQ